jgi:5-methylcytosine-specific restriction endonuclease McrA
MVERGMSHTAQSFETLSDDELLAATKRLVANERAATVALLRSLLQVDARRLYLREGCASLFTYCTQVLHLAEGAAYNRIEAARAARKYPIVLDALAAGSITLTSTRLLAPHLTDANHRDLLEAASHKSKREVELLIATLCPRPAAPTMLRRQPLCVEKPTQGPVLKPANTTAAPPHTDCAVEAQTLGTHFAHVAAPTCPITREPATRRTASSVSPLSANDYRLQVTISGDTHNKLRRAQDLLRHSIPSGDVAAILERALTLLLTDLERRRCAAASRPRQDETAVSSGTRHIPASVRRAVWRRDQGRCAFVGRSGRCRETGFLEFHHVQPHATGGPATADNIQLRCRSHNLYEATLFFGDGGECVREWVETWKVS